MRQRGLLQAQRARANQMLLATLTMTGVLSSDSDSDSDDGLLMAAVTIAPFVRKLRSAAYSYSRFNVNAFGEQVFIDTFDSTSQT